MAFGMSPFPLQFGSRGGGGVAAPLSAAQLRTDLAALGFTVTRSGSKQSHILGSGLAGFENISANVATFERVTIGSRIYLGLIAQETRTPLVADSDDLTGWDTSGSPSVAYTASGGLGAAGYTTITGTGSAWTVSLPITDAEALRRSRVRYYAPASNSGPITLSQDDSSTTVTVVEGSVQDVDLAAQTAANPVLEIAGDGTDSIIIYDFQHEKPSGVMPPLKWPAPQGETPAPIGSDLIQKTLLDPIESLDCIFTIACPPAPSGVHQHLLTIGTGADRFIDAYVGEGDNLISIYGTNTSVQIYYLTRTIPAGGVIAEIKLKVSSGLVSLQINNETAATATPSGSLPSATDIYIGSYFGVAQWWPYPILGIEDISGTLLGSAGEGWGV